MKDYRVYIPYVCHPLTKESEVLILMIQFSDFQSRLEVTACEIGIDEHASCNLSHYSRYIASVCCQLQIYKAVTRHGIWDCCRQPLYCFHFVPLVYMASCYGYIYMT